ncbi:MAG: hypothetical protein HY897_08155 [Deltaproteobacteria bacterium]|nr:hypothetical protein [Deltaproteobacteria bacterium]
MRKGTLACAVLALAVLWSAQAGAGSLMGQSPANVIEYFKSSMPGWEFNGKGFNSIEYKNKAKNFVIRVYVKPNVVGVALDSYIDANHGVQIPQTKEGDKVFKKTYHIEETDIKNTLNALVGGSNYKLTPMQEDEYFSKARETTGSIKTPTGSYNVKDFSVMSLPNETIRVRVKFSVGQTF